MSSTLPPDDPDRLYQYVKPEFSNGETPPRRQEPSRWRWLPHMADRAHRALSALVIGVIALALVVLALFLPPIKLWDTIDDYLNKDDEATSESLADTDNPVIALAADSPSLYVDGLTLDANPEALGAPFGVRVVSVGAEDYLAGRVPYQGWHCGIDLPAGHALAGQVYSLTQEGTPPERLRVQVAPRADVSLTPGIVALYDWDADAQAWVFLPAALTDQGTLAADLDYVPRCVAAFRVPESTRLVGVAQDITDTFDAVVVDGGVSLLPGRAIPLPDGSLSIILAPGFAAEQGYDVLPVVQNFDNPAVIDMATVERILGNATLRSEHARQITAFILTNAGYTGAALDYRAVPDDQRDNYSAFVRELADLLHSQGRTLTVILPAPQLSAAQASAAEAETEQAEQAGAASGDWLTPGYDWPVLGALADVIVLRMPLDPRQYSAEALDADPAAVWAISQVSPRKLWLGLDARSVEAQDGGLFVPVTLADALAYLGRMTLDESEGESLAPGDTITARLEQPSGVTARFEDDTALNVSVIHYRAESGETLRSMWLTTPGALYQRMVWADQHNLGGVLIFHLLDAGVVPGTSSAALAYRLDQPDLVGKFALSLEWIVRSGDTVLALESGQPDSAFRFTVPDNLPEGVSELTIEAQLNGASLGSQVIPVMAAQPTPTTEPTAEPTAEPTTEPTAEPTQEATAEPAAQPSATVEPTATGPETEALPGAPPDAVTQTPAAAALEEPTATPEAVAVVPTNTPAAITETPAPEVTVTAAETTAAESATLAPAVADPSTLDALVVPVIDPALLAGVDLSGPFEAGAAVVAADRSMLTVGQMKLGWLRLDIPFTPGAVASDWGETITIAQVNTFKVLVSVAGQPGDLAAAPDWGAYVTEYAQFVGALAGLGVDAIEVWPGANTSAGWPAGTIDPARYAKVLGMAYHAIKTARPATLVISGAPVPTVQADSPQTADAWNDDAFYAGLAAAGGASILDCVGVEYLGGLVGPSATSGDPRGDAAIYTLPGMTARASDAFGGARPLCYTRLGYAAPTGYPYVPDTLAWAQAITPEQAGQWVAEALGSLRGDARVRLAVVWRVEPPSLDTPIERGAYSLLRPDGSCPACALITALFEE